jgi:polyferredoxin
MKLVFTEVDPYYAMYHFFTDEVTIGSIIVLVITLLGSLFIERPWCKYACPYGAFLGLINKISIFKIRNNKNTCTSCKLCNKKCPMNIDISSKKVINDTSCIKCLDCVDDKSCPQSSLSYGLSKKEKSNEDI